MFYGFVITEAGNSLLASIVAGNKFTITKVVMDKGTAESAEAARTLTAPIDPGPNGTSTVPTVEGNAVNMMVEYRLSLIHISEPTRLRRISYAVFCLKKKKRNQGRPIYVQIKTK